MLIIFINHFQIKLNLFSKIKTMCIECLRIWITSVFRYYDDGDHDVYFRAPVKQIELDSAQALVFITSVDIDIQEEGLALLNSLGFHSISR